jgi:hypothetical protein
VMLFSNLLRPSESLMNPTSKLGPTTEYIHLI